jgi:protoporphyrinogen oxidase
MKTAIIMGAGPAGLTAAYELLTKTQIKPIILEMGSQVGGLSRTISYKGNLIDIGGHRFFSKSEKITDWWLQFLPLDKAPGDTTIPITYQNQISAFKIPSQQASGSNGKMLLRPRKSRIYYQHALFDYPLTMNAKTIRNFGIRKISRIGFSYLRAKLFPIKKESSLEQFFINRFGNELYTTFFQGYTEKIWGVPCKNIPADWGRQRIKDLSISKALVQAIRSVFKKNKSLTQKGVSSSLIEQFLYPEKGPGQMWETVAQKVLELGGEIRLETCIEKIHVAAENRVSSVSCREMGSGQTSDLKGDYFFSTIPVKHLIEGLENTPVPEKIKQVASHLQYRDFIIVGMLFKKQKDQSGGKISELKDNWIYLQDGALMAGRLQIFNNWSPFMVKDEENIWVGLEYFCQDTDPVWNKEPEDMIQLALKEIKKTGLINTKEMLDATVIKVPKAYPSYIGSYAQFPLLQEFLDKFGNLYLIGRNGMHRYNNADHSMMTAMVAVDNIIQHQHSRSNIWSVNMEQDFHEERRADD